MANLISAYIPTGKNIVFPFPSHATFKNDDEVFNYVFQNNLYDYLPNKLHFYKTQLIS